MSANFRITSRIDAARSSARDTLHFSPQVCVNFVNLFRLQSPNLNRCCLIRSRSVQLHTPKHELKQRITGRHRAFHRNRRGSFAMTRFFTKSVLATALAATAFASATPASARDYGHRGGGDTAGAAIAGGIIGLALGAIIASSGNKHRDDRYDGYNRNGGGYYRDGRYYEGRQQGSYREDNRRDGWRRNGWGGDREYYERRGYDDQSGNGYRDNDGYRH
jgi:hypothetical protein